MNGLLIGRFQPFHLGHLEAFMFALSKVEKLSIGIGSSNKPLQKQNPFSAHEREEMILSSVNDSTKQKIQIYYIPDLEDHQKWIKNIETIVPKFDIVFSNDDLTKHLYSKKSIQVLPIPFMERDNLSGTNIRDRIVNGQEWEHLVPQGTQKVLKKIDAKKRITSL